MQPTLSIVRRRDELPEGWSDILFASRLCTWLHPWGDPPEQIEAALDYVFSPDQGRGGFLVLAMNGRELPGAAVVLDTGMSGYIPRHHLVYVAVDPKWRGKGLGARLVSAVLGAAGTAVSLHIDADNPAIRLYEQLGFSVKYLEMRTENA